MKKVGLPPPSVKNKMKKDGIHEYWIRDFFGEPQPMVGGDEEEKEEVMKEPHPKPDMSKYERMKKVGLPEGSVRNKMKQDGIHIYWQCVFFGDPLPKIKKKGKKKKKVKRKVKPLHWRKKSDCDWTNTIWANINIQSPDNLQLKTITSESLITPELTQILEKVFSNIRVKKEKKKGGGKKKEEAKEITLIDPKRAFNMIVGLRQFEKLNINDMKIRNYLLKLDDSKLTIEMLENLSKFVPNNEELNELRNFKGNKEKLARGEKFVDVMTCMVDIKMRIDLWQFKIKFRENVFEVETRINKIRSTLDKLKTSPQIASFLKICLIIGNFMNEGTNRGGAKGIKLESIDRFASLKTADNSMTMLMFIMDHIYKNYNKNNEFTSFPDELLDIVESSKKIEAKTIRDGIADMKDSLERIGKRITRTSRNLKQIQDQFHKSVGNVLSVMSKLRANASKMKTHKSKRKKQGRGSLRLDLGDDGNVIKENEETDDKANKNMLKNKNLLVGVPISDDDTDADTEDAESIKQKRKKKGKKISFVDDLLAEASDSEQKKEEKYSKYRLKNKQKSKRFIIIDPEYKGKRKRRIRKEYDMPSPTPNDDKKQDEDDPDNIDFNMFTRGETVYESDPDFDDIRKSIKADNIQVKPQNGSSPTTHQRTPTLRRKKKKLKKVKIRRLKRVRKKNKSLPQLQSPVSTKTAKTIQKLKEQKENDSTLVKTETDRKDDKDKKRKSIAGKRKSVSGGNKKTEDPNKPPADKFESMMTGFHTMACNKVEALDKQFENLKIFAGNVAVFFGEHDDLEWEELFRLFITFFESINKAKKQNADLEKKREKQRKKEERERAKAERMKKRGLKPKNGINGGKKSDEPVNILEEIRMKNAKGTLTPSKAKNDIVGYEKVDDTNKNKDGDGKKKKKKKKKNPFGGGGGGMSLLDQIKARGQ